MEDHKSEIEDWDLGAGIYISFYVLRSSLQEDNDTMSEMVRKSISMCHVALFSNIFRLFASIFCLGPLACICCLFILEALLALLVDSYELCLDLICLE